MVNPLQANRIVRNSNGKKGLCKWTETSFPVFAIWFVAPFRRTKRAFKYFYRICRKREVVKIINSCRLKMMSVPDQRTKNKKGIKTEYGFIRQSVECFRIKQGTTG